MARKF